jgi:hypothetical protein
MKHHGPEHVRAARCDIRSNAETAQGNFAFAKSLHTES